MNYITKDLVDYIIATIPDIGVEDETIFYDYIPKEPDNIISFVEFQGTGVAMFTDTSVRSVQCQVRNITNTEAKEICWNVFAALKPGSPFIQLGQTISIMNMRDTPVRFRTDDKGRSIWGFDMGITYNYKEFNPNDFN